MKRAKCIGCGYSVRLRKDGTAQAHSIYYGWTERHKARCIGSGKMPEENQ